MIWGHWTTGTNEATLALYRHADPDRLAHAGKDLGRLTCPALVLWGDQRPLPQAQLRRGLRREPSRAPTLQVVPAAGHWPWIDDARGRSTAVLDFLA